MKLNKYIVIGAVGLLTTAGCNSDEEFINPFTSEDGIASLGAFVRFEETPTVIADGDLPFDQLGSFTLTGELVDPAGNVQSYDLRVALNPESSSIDEYVPLLTVDSFEEDVPVPLSVSTADIVGALGIEVADLSLEDEISFQAVTTRDDGVTFGFSNLTNNIFSAGERQAMFFELEVVDSRPEATYFTLVPDASGDIVIGSDTLAREDVDVTPLAEGATRTIYLEYNNALQTLPSLSIDTANGGTVGAVEEVSLSEEGEDITVYRTTFTAGSLADTEVDVSVTGAQETDEDGGETMVDDSFTIVVDNTAPVFMLSYSAPATDTALAVTITATFDEVIQDTPPPAISISGQGITAVENVAMEVLDGQMIATYLFEPRGEGEVTEGPLTLTISATDLAGNEAVANPDNPDLPILR